MRAFSGFLARILLGVLTFIVVRAIIGLLHAHGVYPENEIAAWLTAHPTEFFKSVLTWTIVGAAALLAWLVADYFVYRRPNHRPLRINYSNKANLDHLQSVLRQSSCILPSGKPFSRRITYHKIFVGVTNRGQTTIRNARLTATTLNLPPHGIELTFKPKDSKGDRVDIQPQSTELFLVLTGYDDNDVGMFSPKFIEPADYDRLVETLESKEGQHVGATLMSWMGSGIQLLKNDGYVVDVSVLADDVKPLHALVIVDAKERIALFVFGSRLHLRTMHLISQFLDKTGIGKIGRHKWPVMPKVVRKRL